MMWGWVFLLGVIGVGLLTYGLWEEMRPREVKVEIVKSNSPIANSLIVVDVAGAVEIPGVYRFESGSRIGDALVAAGGVGANADREWVSQNMNLAKEIKDQEKIFIPALDRVDPSQTQGKGSTLGEQKTGKININTASASELDSLPGIGEVRARAIIDNRPYGAVEELVSKAKVPKNVYEDIVNLVRVY